jgi:hypothetical protein
MEDYSHLDRKTQSRIKRRLARGLPPFSKNQLKQQKSAEQAMLDSVAKHIKY